MALKNSKTGSLPVSEIYSFMKEHFPYFKVCYSTYTNGLKERVHVEKECDWLYTTPLPADCTWWMEELSQTQPVPKQMLWESGEQDEQLIP